jgi:Na+-transporting NADH:ubiquinone oxidoreductase subunit A
MPDIIKLRKGLDINLKGVAEKNIARPQQAERYAVSPPDFVGITPKLLVSEGDTVKAGTPLFFSKNNPQILFTSPVSGTVEAINRGEKRRILNITVKADGAQTYETFDIKPLESSSREDVAAVLLKCGLWPCIIQRPYGIIADPADTPRDIFISGFDSAPLAPDMNFALADQYDNLRKGIEALKKLTSGTVYLGLDARHEGVLNMLKGAEQHLFAGRHPAGNVGVQIHNIRPINKGEKVWTVDIQNVALIGRFFIGGKLDMTKVYAVTGSEMENPRYVAVINGAPVASIFSASKPKPRKEGDSVRIISGNVLTGTKVEADGYVSFYSNQVTVIPEGDKYEFLGWAKPRLNRFSVSGAYFSWLTPHKQYVEDTNMNGGHRPFVVTGLFEKYVPMDIYPMYLLKAILAEDIDKMENYGIYEIIEEDFALCEFADPSKNDIQKMVRDGINLMIKELS